MTGRLARWLLASVHRPRSGSVPSLTIVRHHRIYAEGETPLYRLGVSEGVFREQLRALEAWGLRPITVREGLEWLAGASSGRRVVLTFDDGYEDNVGRALPILRAHGARATFYLTSGLIERRQAPWWDELSHLIERTPHLALDWEGPDGRLRIDLATRPGRRAALARWVAWLRVPPAEQRARLDRLRVLLGVDSPAPCELAGWDRLRALHEAGMELGAHTLEHPFLSLLDEASQRREIEGSIGLLRERLGAPVEGLAYPAGDHDERTMEVCRAVGLRYAVTTRGGDVVAESPRMSLARRGWSEGACLGPGGAFSHRLARAELDGAFDRLRRTREVV